MTGATTATTTTTTTPRMAMDNNHNNHNNDDARRQNIVIVGAGIAGLATAVALLHNNNHDNHHHPMDITLLESSTVTELQSVHTGAAIQLTPNGLYALEQLGGVTLVQAVLQHAAVLQQSYIMLPSKEQLFDHLVCMPSTATSTTNVYPTIMIRWGVLRHLLLERLQSLNRKHQVHIECDVAVVQAHLNCNAGGAAAAAAGGSGAAQVQQLPPHLVLRNRAGIETMRPLTDKSTSTSNSTLLIAADGVHSIFRPSHCPLQYNNRINIKGVVPQVIPGSDPHSTYSMFFPSGLACFLRPASSRNNNNNNNNDGWTYWSLSVVVPVPIEMDASRRTNSDSWYHGSPAQVQAHLLSSCSDGSGDVLAEMPLRERTLWMDLIRATAVQQMVVQASVEAPLPESFFQSYHNHNGSSSSHDDTDTADDNLYVCWVGDAAHAMSAAYGQAIAFAMEDAAVLGHCFWNGNHHHHHNDKNNLTDRLTMYTQQRRGRCLEMQQRAHARAAYVTQQGRAPPVDTVTEWIHAWRLLLPPTSSTTKQQEQEVIERGMPEDEQMVVVG